MMYEYFVSYFTTGSANVGNACLRMARRVEDYDQIQWMEKEIAKAIGLQVGLKAVVINYVFMRTVSGEEGKPEGEECKDETDAKNEV